MAKNKFRIKVSSTHRRLYGGYTESLGHMPSFLRAKTDNNCSKTANLGVDKKSDLVETVVDASSGVVARRKTVAEILPKNGRQSDDDISDGDGTDSIVHSQPRTVVEQTFDIDVIGDSGVARRKTGDGIVLENGGSDTEDDGSEDEVCDTSEEDLSDAQDVHKQTLVRGQSIIGLYEDNTEMDGLGDGAVDDSQFTNGFGIDLEHYLQSFVECPAEKLRSEWVFKQQKYRPSDALLVASVNCFSKKKKAHFFRDGLYLCQVFAKEMAMSMSDFLSVRGWLVVKQKNGTVSFSYRRIGDCLSILGTEGASNYFRVSAMFEHLFRVLNSSETMTVLPHEKEREYSVNDNRAINKRNVSKKSVQDPRKKQKKGSEGGKTNEEVDPYNAFFQETSIEKCTLPCFDKVEMREFQKPSTAFAKLLKYQQTHQLGMGAVHAAFDQVLTKRYHDDQAFMEQLFAIIFSQCGTRRMMLQGIQSLLMVCKDENTIREKTRLLESWIKGDQTLILKKAIAETSHDHMCDYLKDLDCQITSTFQRSSLCTKSRSPDRNLLVLKYIVHMHIRIMDHKKGHAAKSESAMVSYRNQDTPIEASVAMRSKKANTTNPSTSVLEQLKTTPSFFAMGDRIHAMMESKDATVEEREAVLESNYTLEEDSGKLTTAMESKDATVEEREAVLESNYTLHEDSGKLTTDVNDDKIVQQRPRFDNVRVASVDEVRKIHHRLVMRQPGGVDVYLHHHPMEVYAAWGLHKISHVYENNGPIDHWPPRLKDLDSPVFLFSDSMTVQMCPDLCMVVRPGSHIYNVSFTEAAFQIPIEIMLDFVVRNGKSDLSRSTGWRMDLSNAGQAYEAGTGFTRPKILCGEKVFLDDLDGEIVRKSLGMLVDGVCEAGKLMCLAMKKDHSLKPKRYFEYALKLQEFLFAKCSYVESITLQLLNLSLGDHGEEHVDVMNDHRSSYDCTMVKVMNFVDSNDHLYSLKIVCGFRKRLGDFYSVSMSKIEGLLVNSKAHLREVNASYTRLNSHHLGSHHPDLLPTWYNIDELYIDDNSHWTGKLIEGTQVFQESLEVLTGVSRGIWLSAALSAIYEKAPEIGETGVIQLLMIMSWQNSFQHFWEICKRMYPKEEEVRYGEKEREKGGKLDAIYEYYRVAHELFYVAGKEKGQEMFGGVRPRFGPVGMNFVEVFGTDRSPKSGIATSVCKSLIDFLVDINTLDGIVSRESVMNKVSMAKNRIREIAKCELGDFRLMIFLQGAIFLRVRLTPRENLREIFFPVKGSGSWDNVIEAGIGEESMEAVCLEVQSELSTIAGRVVPMDEVEVILCESKDGRLLKKFDLIIKGQSLFKMDERGCPHVKAYGEKNWRMVESVIYKK